jgi:hypothetical protein
MAKRMMLRYWWKKWLIYQLKRGEDACSLKFPFFLSKVDLLRASSDSMSMSFSEFEGIRDAGSEDRGIMLHR